MERGVGSLPSIAVFVDDASLIDPLAGEVRERLKPHNIGVMGYKDGLVIGDDREVRIFDIRHVKGMSSKLVLCRHRRHGVPKLGNVLPIPLCRHHARGDVSGPDVREAATRRSRAGPVALLRRLLRRRKT